MGALLFVFRDSIFRPNSYRTAVGGLQAVPMVDGSRITLNTDSAIHISLSKQERSIDLEKGEAFFQVARDPARPFVVRAGNKRVIAVGTQFSVRRDDDDVLVSVTEGSVRFEAAASRTLAHKGNEEDVKGYPQEGKRVHPQAEALLLPAGTTAHTRAGNIVEEKTPISEIEGHLTWRSGILTFHDTPLGEAAAEFNRYNRRKFVIRDPAVGHVQVGGIFGATTLDPFIYLLRSGFPVRVTEEGDQIILSAR